MQIHQLKRKNKNKKPARIGRGGKRGKTSGRGTKGQKARAGRKIRPEIRDVIKRLPKLRGRGKSSLKSFALKPTIVKLAMIEKVYADREEVTPKSLVEKGVLSFEKGLVPKVKILNGGDISKKVVVSGCAISAGAREKIEKAGGEVK